MPVLKVLPQFLYLSYLQSRRSGGNNKGNTSASCVGRGSKMSKISGRISGTVGGHSSDNSIAARWL